MPVFAAFQAGKETTMIDLNRLQQQFEGFNTYQAEEQARMRQRLRRALMALEECAPFWEDLRAHVLDVKPGWLVAGLRESPGAVYPQGERPTPITVVATDGSQIYPDRHVQPTCFLLNVSRIAFQYGTLERPLMEAVPDFRFRRADQEHFDEVLETANAEVVSAVRDELELDALFDTADRCRTPGRPLVALADGTLIRWMLRGMRNRELEDRLIARYTEILTRFREEQIPLCSYISMPGNTEVVNLLRVHAGECEVPPAAEETLEGLTDRQLFEATLQPGERSAIFESSSHIQEQYGAADRICYFYIRTSGEGSTSEIGRVEVPLWVAEDAPLVDLVHAVVLSECEKGDGYPMILAEAHERAVIRAREKEVFYQMVEREMQTSGLPHATSQKSASKRRPRV